MTHNLTNIKLPVHYIFVYEITITCTAPTMKSVLKCTLWSIIIPLDGNEDRIRALEKRVEMQDDEIALLKSAMADMLRRLNETESNSVRKPFAAKSMLQKIILEVFSERVFFSYCKLLSHWCLTLFLQIIFFIGLFLTLNFLLAWNLPNILPNDLFMPRIISGDLWYNILEIFQITFARCLLDRV